MPALTGSSSDRGRNLLCPGQDSRVCDEVNKVPPKPGDQLFSPEQVCAGSGLQRPQS